MGTRCGLVLEVCGAGEIESGQRGSEMKIEDRLGAGLTISQAGELFTVAEGDFNLEAGGFCRKVDSNTLLSTISGIFRAQTFQYMV